MKFPIIMFVLAAFFLSCTYENQVNNILSCREKVLKENNMVSYTGVEPYCESIWAYEYKGDEYYCIDLCTADMICNPFDCNNVYFFTKDGTANGEFDNEKYILFSEKKKLVGIVGVKQ